MANQYLADIGLAGGALAMALLDVLIAEGVLTKGQGLRALRDAQLALTRSATPQGASAARIIGTAYDRITKSD